MADLNDVATDAGTGAALGSVVPGIGTIAGGAAGGLVGLLGGLFGQGSRNAATTAQQNVLNQYQGLTPPQLSVNFQNYKSAGNYNPALEQTLQQGQSQLNSIQSNPQLMQARLSALNSLQNVANNGGMTQQDQANLQRMMSQTGAANAGAQGAIMQGMAQRGMAGSGMQLAAQLAAQQNAANQNSQQGLNLAAQAQQNALNAMSQGGLMANAYNNANFNQQAQIAQAQDAINRFNTQNSQQVAGQNTQAQNYGQMYNLQNQQQIANANTGLANQQQLQNNQYQQQNYADQLQKLGGEQGAANSLAGQYNTNANAYSQMFGQLGQGLAKAGTASSVAQQPAAPQQPSMGAQQWQGLRDQAQGSKDPESLY